MAEDKISESESGSESAPEEKSERKEEAGEKKEVQVEKIEKPTEDSAVRHHGKENKLPEIEGDEDKILWKAPEFVYREKSIDWYWIIGIITVTIIVIAVILSNTLFALFALVAGGAMMLYGSHKPETLSFEVNERGVQKEGMLTPYHTLDFFWIDESGDTTQLLVQQRKTTAQLIVFPVEGVTTGELRDFLLDFMDEDYIERPWAELLMERIGF